MVHFTFYISLHEFRLLRSMLFFSHLISSILLLALDGKCVVKYTVGTDVPTGRIEVASRAVFLA